MPARDRYLDDFEPGVAHWSPAHTISAQEARAFAERYDPRPIHLDAVAAREAGFEGVVCSDLQVAALSWGLVQRTGFFDRSPLAGIGVDDVRSLAPVQPGDTLRCRFTLVDATPSTTKPDRGVARFRSEMVDQGERIVLTLVIVQLLRRRPA